MDAPIGFNHTAGITPHDRPLAAAPLAPTLLLISVAAAIASQLGAPLPLAGACALAAWGTALAAARSGLRLVVALAVYTPLVALAIIAQIDAASGTSAAREFIAAMDSGAAVGLLVLLLRRV